MAMRHPANRLRHGRGKQRHLLFRRSLFQNPVHIVDEAHAQHFIGFVQHHGAQRRQRQGFPAQMIHDPARRADHDVNAAPQMTQLQGHALAAIDRQNVKTGQMTGVALEGFRDLNRQFPGRRQHQRLGLPVAPIQFFQNRQGESGGLAGAGLGLAQHVMAFQHRRNSRRLNWRRRFVAEFLKGVQQGRRQRELFKMFDEG